MKIRLVWNNGAEQIEETCLLIDEDSTIFACNGVKLELTSEDLIASLDGDIVLFEDEEGIFGLKPDQIVSISPVS